MASTPEIWLCAPDRPPGKSASKLDLSAPAWSGVDMTIDPALIAAANVSKAWPFEEARKLFKRFPQGKPGGSAVVFETGYGPSGLHISARFRKCCGPRWCGGHMRCCLPGTDNPRPPG